MLVITRFRVPPEAAEGFVDDLRVVAEALAARPGFADAFIGRNLDDPTLWTLSTRWDSVGAYRRGLSAYEVKVATARPYAYALEEPSAYTDAFQDVVTDHDSPLRGNS